MWLSFDAAGGAHQAARRVSAAEKGSVPPMSISISRDNSMMVSG